MKNTLKKIMITAASGVAALVIMMNLTIIPAGDMKVSEKYSALPVIETQEPEIGEDGDSLFDLGAKEPEVSSDSLFTE